MRIIFFAILSGVASGLLIDTEHMVVPGVLFAAAVVLGSYARFHKVGLLRVLSFTALSVAANVAAVQLAMSLSSPGGHDDWLVGGAAGLVGSTILGIAMRLCFRMTPALKTILSFALVGTAAGAVFFYLPQPWMAYAIWQALIGALIARHFTKRAA